MERRTQGKRCKISFKIPKGNFAIVNLVVRSIRKSSANYANSYTESTRRFCTCFNHVFSNCIDEAKRAKANKVQLPEELFIRQYGRRFFVFVRLKGVAKCMAFRGNDLYIPPLSIYLTPAQSVTGHYF